MDGCLTLHAKWKLALPAEHIVDGCGASLHEQVTQRIISGTRVCRQHGCRIVGQTVRPDRLPAGHNLGADAVRSELPRSLLPTWLQRRRQLRREPAQLPDPPLPRLRRRQLLLLPMMRLNAMQVSLNLSSDKRCFLSNPEKRRMLGQTSRHACSGPKHTALLMLWHHCCSVSLTDLSGGLLLRCKLRAMQGRQDQQAHGHKERGR
jgi:hypothetical protein